MAQGKFPLADVASDSGYWGLLKAICEDDLPLPDGKISKDFSEFIFECLVRNPNTRKSSGVLLSSNQFLNRGRVINKSLEKTGTSNSAEPVRRFSVESLQSQDDNSSGSLMSLGALHSWRAHRITTSSSSCDAEFASLIDANVQGAIDSLREDHLLRILFRLHQNKLSYPDVKIPGFLRENEAKWKKFAFQLCLLPETVVSLAKQFLADESFLGPL